MLYRVIILLMYALHLAFFLIFNKEFSTNIQTLKLQKVIINLQKTTTCL